MKMPEMQDSIHLLYPNWKLEVIGNVAGYGIDDDFNPCIWVCFNKIKYFNDDWETLKRQRKWRFLLNCVQLTKMDNLLLGEE